MSTSTLWSTKLKNVVCVVRSEILCAMTLRQINTSDLCQTKFSSVLLKKKTFVNDYEQILKNQRKSVSPTMVLLSPNGKTQIMNLDSAIVLAQQRKMKLIKIEDNKISSQHKNLVYKLISADDYKNAVKDQKETVAKPSKAFREEKVVVVGHQMMLYDYEVKAKKLIKWLEKIHQVTVIFNLNKAGEYNKECYDRFVEDIKGYGKIIQESKKSDLLKVCINPLKKLSDLDTSKHENVDAESVNQK